MDVARWDPSVYARFGDERLRPASDLIARIPLLPSADAAGIYDLGCGTGNVTRLLAERFAAGDALPLTGVDRSAAMLDEARAGAPELEWEQADLATWRPTGKAALIFSNAALHWLPHHARVLSTWMDALVPGGVLAVQAPRSWSNASHRLLRETLDEGFGSEALRAGMASPPVLEPQAYIDILSGLASAVDVWETTYYHQLTGEDAVLRWVEGTTLRPVATELDADTYARFRERYRAKLADAYPVGADGRTLYPFPRLFFVAVR